MEKKISNYIMEHEGLFNKFKENLEKIDNNNEGRISRD